VGVVAHILMTTKKELKSTKKKLGKREQKHPK
jgi:hypothetical protein